ncbi:MAG: response regulator [Betaproteobacteria bacterium]|nr:response regulator [Betaproteobacteria bacterium]
MTGRVTGPGSARAGETAQRRETQIREAQLRALHNQSGVALAASAMAALLLVLVMWESVPKAILFGWLGVFFVLLTYRMLHLLRYRRAAPPPARPESRLGHFMLGALASGCVWGSAGLLMYVPGSLAHQALLSTILFAVSAGSAGVYPIYLPTYYAFIAPTLFPVIVRMAWQADATHLTIGLMGITVLATLLVIGRNLNRIMTESLNTRFENLDLIEALTRQTATAEAAKQEAEASNRAKSQFLAAASHDLRQPLHALGLFVAALNEKACARNVRDIVDHINSSVESLEVLFNELLDVSKLDAGVVRPSVRPFPIRSLLDRLRSDYRALAAEKGLGLIIYPSAAQVMSDLSLLERILRNLLSNAIRYTEKGGITVECQRRGDILRIDVWDTGIGIPADQHQRIFEEFYQVGNPGRDRRKGLGLGLAIVRRLARLLGHRLEMNSTVGGGSVFSVEVPLAKEARPETPEAEGTAVANATLAGRRIVVVDDEQTVRDGMQALLTGWGCEVIVAASADEALERVANAAGRPELVIADYRLQGGANGIEAIRHLRAVLGANVPGILITGDTAPDRLNEAAASGYHLLHKPVRPARLRALISGTLRDGGDLPS